jgi:hypothetical protein
MVFENRVLNRTFDLKEEVAGWKMYNIVLHNLYSSDKCKKR